MYKKLTLAVALLLGLVSAVDHWAVLVAGSNGFWNYRHQADVCHAYQVLKKNGFPEANIITMAFDDIANDPENPIPGKLYNKPNGDDVYAGCKIDYKGNDVTPANFLAILQGDATKVKGGNGKVLKSTSQSKVFINFSDHGAPGLIAFPNEYLYAKDLNDTFTLMNQKKTYQELVFYLEACESGSMFDGILAANTNIYAVTAANPFESSWGTYCPPDDMVGGVEINSCLGDLFSVNWMEDSDKANIQKETLDQQFAVILNTTDKSHVMRYGDQKFVSEPIGNFIGTLNLAEPEEDNFFESIFNKAKQITGLEDNPMAVDERKTRSAVNSRDIKLNHLHAKVQRKNSEAAQKELQAELNKRMRADHAFDLFAAATGVNTAIEAGDKVLPRDFECLKTVMAAHDSTCGKFDDYSLQYVKYIVHACEANVH